MNQITSTTTALVFALAAILPRDKILLDPPHPGAHPLPRSLPRALAYAARRPPAARATPFDEFAALADKLLQGRYTQATLARALNVHRTTVSAWLAFAKGRPRAQPAAPPSAAVLRATRALAP